MSLLPVLLSLTAILLPSCGDAEIVPFNSLSTTLEKNQQEIVDVHNALRSKASPTATNMLKMKWNKAAQKTAQDWANNCTLKHSNAKNRTIGTVCGENLFMSSAPFPWEEAIQAWYDEVTYFVYGKGSTTGEAVGHYTQVMWYASHEIGCAVAKCPEAALEYFYVCHYCPAGNILPRQNSPYETGTPCAKCPNDCSNNLCTNPCSYTDHFSNCPELKMELSCQHTTVMTNCKASCQCNNKIY